MQYGAERSHEAGIRDPRDAHVWWGQVKGSSQVRLQAATTCLRVKCGEMR